MDWFGTGTLDDEKTVKTVSEVSGEIKKLLDDESLRSIWVEGEITNFKRHTSGHLYFSLTEIRNQKTYILNCTMWRSAARELDYAPQNGVKVKIYGSIEVYEPHGKYQFIARDMVPAGEGDKHLLVMKWKNDLFNEGLFEEWRKKPLPKYPMKVGVVTSPVGAARRDIENVIERRYPVEVIISPAKVQGDFAHIEIADAIHRIDGLVDAIIVGRGGGSFEDLFAFNHPDVVRAVAGCKTPIVSAVGHEVDYTLCDLAADIRAPTPSAAAEIVVPDINDLFKEMQYLRKSLDTGILGSIEKEQKHLENLCSRLHPRRLERLVNEQYERLDEYAGRLQRGINSGISVEKLNLKNIRAKIEGLDPSYPLKRGFCMIKSGKNILNSVSEMKKGDLVTFYMKDGSGDALIKEIYYEEKL
ncbi:exodeoxyribonuclease VII large subunit [Methanoplanus sp. FWC-SCC4]|uniref:Exodeoxyribonuclease VII large subunit n=1 Tax=Methanochimaera problematica TaxID=2609417 RepID=A0AA97FCZ4_9EURY|nr:exodeoxyribonuclease VII large subunit [Methanoplanus sp. FWC-SCC4]WOF15773.1 exodeoxyribonuclease VII large subunit [Methanoplanus sp. FWC-SCC4]